jgi:phosphonatase-like hydrolase
MIRMVVFDMAGTTIDENNVVYKTLQKAINENGFNISLDQVLEEGAGKEKSQAIKSILKEYAEIEDNKRTGEIYQHFIILLNEAYRYLDVKAQPNAVELFKILKRRNILVILNTGYNSETAYSLLEKLGWIKGVEFDGLITASDVNNNRPDPDMILLAMKRFGIQDATEVIKLGDSIIDIEEGRNAGCALSIGITSGAHSFKQLESAKPDFIIDDLLELVPLIR